MKDVIFYIIGGFVIFLIMLPLMLIIKDQNKQIRQLSNDSLEIKQYYEDKLARKFQIPAWYVSYFPELNVHKITLTEKEIDGTFTVAIPSKTCHYYSGIKLYNTSDSVPEEYVQSFNSVALFDTPEEAYKYAIRLVQVRISRIKKQEEPWLIKLTEFSEKLESLTTE